MTLRFADPPSLFRPALPPGLLSGDLIERAREIINEQQKPYLVGGPAVPTIRVLSYQDAPPVTFQYMRAVQVPALLRAATERAHAFAGEELGVAGVMDYFETLSGRGRCIITADCDLSGLSVWERDQFWISAEQDAESAVRTVGHELHHLHYIPLHPGATHEAQEKAASDYAAAFLGRWGSRIMQQAKLQVADPPIDVMRRN